MKKIIGTAMLAAALSVSLPVYSGGGGLTGGATEITQLLNNAELLDIAVGNDLKPRIFAAEAGRRVREAVMP